MSPSRMEFETDYVLKFWEFLRSSTDLFKNKAVEATLLDSTFEYSGPFEINLKNFVSGQVLEIYQPFSNELILAFKGSFWHHHVDCDLIGPDGKNLTSDWASKLATLISRFMAGTLMIVDKVKNEKWVGSSQEDTVPDTSSLKGKCDLIVIYKWSGLEKIKVEE